jgi:tight adherence protein C
VITAVRQTVERGRGVAVNDLAEALRLHRSGMTAATSFRRIAELSPEPHAKRLYSLLATAEERGSDLAAALLALSRDVRDDRRDALKRAATKRRAAMLLPIVALLAPILIMFIAAPLPWIIFGELR